MQANEDSKFRNRILSTIEIAFRCSQALSVNEIALMLPLDQEPSKIQEIIQNDPYISKSVSREKEFVVLRGYENLFSERTFRERISKRYLEIATVFVDQLIRRSSYVKLMAVCGSVAYGSATKSDDIDFFLITKENRMWLAFLKTLLLARAFDIKASIKGQKANFCLSYVKEEKHFEEEIRHNRTPLLAREFLSIQVLTGINYYAALFDRTSWVRHMFPRLYASKLIERDKNKMSHIENGLQLKVNDALNLFIYATLKGYLLFKAFLRNLRYRKQHKIEDIFEATITKGSCVYTSERYRELEKMYDLM